MCDDPKKKSIQIPLYSKINRPHGCMMASSTLEENQNEHCVVKRKVSLFAFCTTFYSINFH